MWNAKQTKRAKGHVLLLHHSQPTDFSTTPRIIKLSTQLEESPYDPPTIITGSENVS